MQASSLQIMLRDHIFDTIAQNFCRTAVFQTFEKRLCESINFVIIVNFTCKVWLTTRALYDCQSICLMATGMLFLYCISASQTHQETLYHKQWTLLATLVCYLYQQLRLMTIISLPSITIVGFHMTSLNFKFQNFWSSWDFTFMVYKSS